MVILTGIQGKVYEVCNYLGSILVALLRLFVLIPLTVLSCLNQILFSRYEICAVELKMLPLRCDRKDVEDKLSYVDKLCAENPELLDLPDDFDDDDIDNYGDSNR